MQKDATHKFLGVRLLGLADFNVLNNHTSFGSVVYYFVMKCLFYFVFFIPKNSLKKQIIFV